MSILLCSAMLLAACNKTLPPPKLAEQPKPIATDPRLCADLKPEPQIQGSLVEPVTPEEKEVTRLLLNSVSEVIAWGRQGWSRAAVAKKAGC